jgi:hypothetical protein
VLVVHARDVEAHMMCQGEGRQWHCHAGRQKNCLGAEKAHLPVNVSTVGDMVGIGSDQRSRNEGCRSVVWIKCVL